MDRSVSIVLGRPSGPLPTEAKARPVAVQYWRTGSAVLSALLTVLSVLFHVVMYEGLALSGSSFHPAPSAASEPLPVEIVPRVPDPKPEEEKKKLDPPPKADELKPEPPKTAELPKAPGPPDAKTSPDPPLPASPPPVPAAKAAPPPPAHAAPERPLPSPPSIAQPPPPPVPDAGLLPVPPPIPEAEAPKGPVEGLKVDADEVPPPPSDRKALGYWELQPLTLNLRPRCGPARITGVLELRERVGEGRFRGVIRTRIAWASCPAEGAVHAIELRIKGDVVTMIGADGSVDRGVISANLMLLEDAYGRSVWKKR